MSSTFNKYLLSQPRASVFLEVGKQQSTSVHVHYHVTPVHREQTWDCFPKLGYRIDSGIANNVMQWYRHWLEFVLKSLA